MADYRNQTGACGESHSRDSLRHFPLAMAFVPWQQWNQTYELKKALQVGTIFPDLDKPFLGKRGACR